MKGYYPNPNAAIIPETKEPRPNQSGLKIELVEKLREMHPDQYDKILFVLRTYPDISSVEDALKYLKLCDTPVALPHPP